MLNSLSKDIEDKRSIVKKNYNRLLKTSNLNYSDLSPLSKIGYDSQMAALAVYRGSKINLNWRDLCYLSPDHIELMEQEIDDNVIVGNIETLTVDNGDNKISVTLVYVFREEIVKIDIQNNIVIKTLKNV